MEIWKELERLSWKPDNKEETTFARILVSNTGKVKRLEHKRWNSVNNTYSIVKEYHLENKVVLIVPKDSDLNISSFEDLKNVDGNIAMGDPSSVPAGQYGKEVLTNLGVWDSVESKLSLGTDVTAVLNQVAQGSAECGIVYSTDAKSNDDVKVVCEAPDDALKTPVIYPVAELKNSEHQDATQKFMEFLKSKEAKDVFVEYGFTIHE